MNVNDNNHFGFMVPHQSWFSPKEMASIIGKTDQYVRDAFDNQKILGHIANGRTPKGMEKRKSYRIHRDGILLYLLETANYSPTDFLSRVTDLLFNRPRSQLEEVRDYVDNLIRRRSQF
jgi:hypothetical protein